MSMSQDEIDNLMSNDTGEEVAEPVEVPGEKLFGQMARLFADAINNIFPILVETEQIQAEPGMTQKGSVGDVIAGQPDGAAFFMFKITALTDIPFVGVIDLPVALNISQRMMGQEGEEALSEALLSALSEAFNNVLGAWDASIGDDFGIELAHSDLKFLEGDPVEVLKSDAGYASDAPAVIVAFSVKIDDLSGGMGLMSTEEAIEQVFRKHPSSQAQAGESEAPAETTEAPAETTEAPAETPAEQPQTAPEEEAVAPVAPVADQPEVPLAIFEPLTPHQTTDVPRGVELILDVPLSIAVELGRQSLSVKDILELAPGSLVELDKLAGEAVDLLINGKLFAKGEVVVIDENFGVRVSSIITPRERLESLR